MRGATPKTVFSRDGIGALGAAAAAGVSAERPTPTTVRSRDGRALGDGAWASDGASRARKRPMEARTASSTSMNVTPMPGGFPSALGASRTQVTRPAADATSRSPGISISSVKRVPTGLGLSVSTKSPPDSRSSQRDTSSFPVALSQRTKPPLRARGSRRRSSTIGPVYRVCVTVSRRAEGTYATPLALCPPSAPSRQLPPEGVKSSRPYNVSR